MATAKNAPESNHKKLCTDKYTYFLNVLELYYIFLVGWTEVAGVVISIRCCSMWIHLVLPAEWMYKVIVRSDYIYLNHKKQLIDVQKCPRFWTLPYISIRCCSMWIHLVLPAEWMYKVIVRSDYIYLNHKKQLIDVQKCPRFWTLPYNNFNLPASLTFTIAIRSFCAVMIFI